MQRLFGSIKNHITIFVVVTVMAVTGTAAAVSAAVAVHSSTSGSAPVSHFTGVDEIVESCTNSTSFVNMPQMSRTFTIGNGTATDEAAAMFQGSVTLGDDGGQFDTGFIRLVVDGNVQPPGTIPLVGVNESGTHGFNWKTNSVKIGTHTAKVQWRTDLGSTFCVDARSLLVFSK